MGVDLIVIPLSRYWAGDYVTPVMRSFWEQGVPYHVVSPGETRELPPGLPFGGASAGAQRAELLQETIPGLMHKLKSVTTDLLWDDRSDVEPCFHRPSNQGVAALMEAAARLTRPSRWPWSRKVTTPPRHLGHAVIHLPIHFSEPLDGAGMVFGSLFALQAELAANTWPGEASDAVEAFQAAARDAERLRLPLVVDS